MKMAQAAGWVINWGAVSVLLNVGCYVKLKGRITTGQLFGLARACFMGGLASETVSPRGIKKRSQWMFGSNILTVRRFGFSKTCHSPSKRVKSTIVQLLLRFYDPGEGEVLFDNVALRDLDPRWVHQVVGVVQQELKRFSMSNKENIRSAVRRMNPSLPPLRFLAQQSSSIVWTKVMIVWSLRKGRI
jgi:hypothetical protein